MGIEGVVKCLKQPDGSILIKLCDGWHRVREFKTYVRKGGRFRQWLKMARTRIRGVLVEICLGVARAMDLIRSIAKSDGGVTSLGVKTRDGREVFYSKFGLSPK